MNRSRGVLLTVAMVFSMVMTWDEKVGAQHPLDRGQFVVVKHLGPGVNSASADVPGSASPDGRTLYFESLRPGTGGVVADLGRADLYRATRKSLSERFGGSELLTALQTPQADGLPFLFSDETGTRIYFSSRRPFDPPGGWDIWEADVDRDGSIGVPRNLGAPINGPSDDFSTSITCDGRELVFASDRMGEGSYDLWIVSREDGGFGTPVNLGFTEGHLVNTFATESFPSISCRGRTLFFSDMTAWGGAPRADGTGGDDLWASPREPDGFFEEPINLGELGKALSTASHEWTPVIGIDWPDSGSVLRFASDRPHPLAQGDFDIYEATWLASDAIDFKDEMPRTRGAINCGGFEVDAEAEIGFVFEEDRFFDDETHYTGDEATGFTVHRTVFGRAYDDWIYRGENPQPIDVSRIPGAGVEVAKLFDTDTRSEVEIHYQALVVPGRYQVTLYFAESSADPEHDLDDGNRFITASLNEQQVLCSWSVAAAAGRLTCEVVQDSAVARSFSLDVPAGQDADGDGTLDVLIAGGDNGEFVGQPYLSALSFERISDVTGEPIRGEIECLNPPGDDGVREDCLKFIRGDANGDGDVNLTDAVAILDGLFGGDAAPGCQAAEDTNGDGGVNLTDAVYILQHLFGGGPRPVDPFPECGFGALESDPVLGCAIPPMICR